MKIFRRFILFALIFAFVLPVASCNKEDEVVLPWDPVEREDENDDPEEDPSDDPAVNPGGDDDDTTVEGKPRLVWIDASANFFYYANSELKIKSELKQVKAAGFTDVVVDVRPTEGVVLFNSKIAPQATKLGAWLSTGYGYVTRTETFDYLQAFIDYGHECGLRVHAALNTFVGGYKYYYGLGQIGPIFDGSIPKSWASVVNTSDGLMNSMDIDSDGGTIFLNPANDEVQDYMISLLKEVAAYDVDGIVLDRCRYDDYGLQSDFSDESRAKFESYIGYKLTNWPTDVFPKGTSTLPTMNTIRKQWLAFRAKNIHDFIEKAAAAVHGVNPDVKFGAYVGAWYSSYYESGVNWASPKYDTGAHYSWANSDYKNYGYADHCDFMILGCYAGSSSIYGSTEWTMEGFCKLGRQLLAGDTVFAGGPDIGNASGFENGGKGYLIPKTIDACINAADAYFCFDLCHIRMYDYWDFFKKGFDTYLQTLNN